MNHPHPTPRKNSQCGAEVWAVGRRWPSTYKALGAGPGRRKQGWWCTSVISVVWRWGQKDQMFRVILGYVASLRSAWTP